jgi:transcriptional regulator with GAF, ATPase, and Fis domain
VLQEQEFERVGGSQTLSVNIRVIAATNRDLWQMVQKGSFRIDLYYRLNVFPIKVPALRERKEDIPYLCSNLIQQLNKRLGKQLKGLSKKAVTKLQAYDWPGNIRELQNVLEREAILSKQSVLQLNQPLNGDTTQNVDESLTLDEAQRLHISRVLTLCNGQISGSKGAALKLGLPESTLRSKMRKLGISK